MLNLNVARKLAILLRVQTHELEVLPGGPYEGSAINTVPAGAEGERPHQGSLPVLNDILS